MPELAEQDATPAPKRRWRIRWWWPLVGLIVLLMVLFLAFRWSLNRAVDAELDAIRAAGYPATAQEADDWYEHVPPNENAAVALMDAFGRMKTPARGAAPVALPLFEQTELPPPTQPLPDEMAAAIETLLADNTEALKRLHKGAAMERSRYPVDLSKGIEAILPSLSELRDGAQLLALEAVWHAEHGRPREATQSVRSVLGVAASLEDEPILISQLVRMAVQTIAVRVLERVVNTVELDDESLIALIKELAEAEHPPVMERAMANERAILSGLFSGAVESLSMVTSRHGDWLDPLLQANQFIAHRFSGTMQMDYLVYLGLTGEYVAASKLPTPQRVAAFEAVENKIFDVPSYAIITKMLVPAVSRAAAVDLRTMAQLRIARTALAVERYRLAHGKLPNDLSELTPQFIDALPADPFTGKPLKYKKSEESYTIYSVGTDKTDDGGAPPPSQSEAYDPGYDVPFTVER